MFNNAELTTFALKALQLSAIQQKPNIEAAILALSELKDHEVTLVLSTQRHFPFDYAQAWGPMTWLATVDYFQAQGLHLSPKTNLPTCGGLINGALLDQMFGDGYVFVPRGEHHLDSILLAGPGEKLTDRQLAITRLKALGLLLTPIIS